MTLHTRLGDLLGVAHPILNAPMGGGDAPGVLAAAVSEAGGLGMIGGTTAGGADWLRDQIGVVQAATSKPFGVGFVSHLAGAAGLMAVALDAGVRVIAHSFSDPTPFVADAHRGGAVVICQVRTLDDAKRAADAGVDVVTAQGTEAGGHTGEVSTLPLVPAVVDAVHPLPVIAAGGIADGRGIAAALMLGAEGVWLGTRFLATPEAGVPVGYKEQVLGAGPGDTVLTEVFDLAAGIPWPAGVRGRSIRNPFTDRWHGEEAALRAERRDSRSVDDGIAANPLYAGEVSGLVTELEPAGQIVGRLVAETEAVLRERTAAILRGV
ncbi:MAG: 2-nitropropane dioxygenase [Actinomycetia bacterium]|nr:2-nitropropane dioxygenase [Actinomycetes bacterium]